MKNLNESTGGLFQIIGFYLIIGASVFTAYAQTGKLLTLSDGRDAGASVPVTVEESRFIEKEVRAKESVVREKSGLDCEEDENFSFNVVSVASGSFTKPNTRQKAYLYELCRSNLTFGIGGIVVAENGKVVTHYIYGENGLESDFAVLPDINRNGFSEIMLIGGGTGQGYTLGAVEIIEFTSRGINSFGIADIYEDNFGTNNAKKSATAYKVSVRTGKNPVYFREAYTRKNEEGKWILTGKSRKYLLRRDYEPKYHKIS